jgi:hypothetical protein
MKVYKVLQYDRGYRHEELLEICSTWEVAKDYCEFNEGVQDLNEKNKFNFDDGFYEIEEYEVLEFV